MLALRDITNSYTEDELTTLIPRIVFRPPPSTSGRSTQVLETTIYGTIQAGLFETAAIINIPQSSYTALWLMVNVENYPIQNNGGNYTAKTSGWYSPVQDRGDITISPTLEKNYTIARQWASIIEVHSSSNNAAQQLTGTLAAGVTSNIIGVQWTNPSDINTKSTNKKNGLIGIDIDTGITQIQGHDINRDYRPITDNFTIQHGDGALIQPPEGRYGRWTIHNGTALDTQPVRSGNWFSSTNVETLWTTNNINIELTNWSFRARPIVHFTYLVQTSLLASGNYEVASEGALNATRREFPLKITITTATCTKTSPPTVTINDHVEVRNTDLQGRASTIHSTGVTTTHDYTQAITINTNHYGFDQHTTILAVSIEPPLLYTIATGAVLPPLCKPIITIPDLYDKEIQSPAHVITWQNVGNTQNIIVKGTQFIQAVSTTEQTQFTSPTPTHEATSWVNMSALYDSANPIFKLSHETPSYHTLEQQYSHRISIDRKHKRF